MLRFLGWAAAVWVLLACPLGATHAAQAAGDATVAIPACEQPPLPPGAVAPVSVTVSAATTWQPRGGEVVVQIAGDAEQLKKLSLRACMRWSGRNTGKPDAKDELARYRDANVHIRPSDVGRIVNLGISVPRLDSEAGSIMERWQSDLPSSGLGVVPLADLRLIGYNDAGVLFDVVEPVGITSKTYALILALICVAVGITAVHRLAEPAAPDPSAAGPRGSVQAALDGLFSFRWVLKLVRNPDGSASLSAFQVLLWTVVVAASAIYVMALSGSLIDISSGTLTMLGIAGAASLIAAKTGSNAAQQTAAAPPAAGGGRDAVPTVPPPASAGPVFMPEWVDLITDENDQPDVTRIQMLLFTVVSAGFVVLQVLNTYVIPEIPVGYQILMGISNGIYVGAKVTKLSRPAK